MARVGGDGKPFRVNDCAGRIAESFIRLQTPGHHAGRRRRGALMAEVRLQQMRKVYPDGHVAVAGASFDVADGELLVLSARRGAARPPCCG
jgi:hypothetical protein